MQGNPGKDVRRSKNQIQQSLLPLLWPNLTCKHMLNEIVKICGNGAPFPKCGFFSLHCHRGCFTTDMWTTQNVSYICFMAHFVDNNQKL
ncbi:hypothetical protein CR513_41066, partial [Mucuna pruriens]